MCKNNKRIHCFLQAVILIMLSCTVQSQQLKRSLDSKGKRVLAQDVNPNFNEKEKERVVSLLAQRFGFGAKTIGGAKGIMTEITNLNDSSLLNALTDDKARWIYFHPSLDGGTWSVPGGSTKLGKFKTIDGRKVKITFQYGIPNNNLGINKKPVKTPVKTGQLVGIQGELIITGIRHVGDLGWPYKYEKPYFSNGATDGLEIWGGTNYWIHDNIWSRFSDESLGVYHNGGNPDLITFSRNIFKETKTASLIGNQSGEKIGNITIAYNVYTEMVNGRSPGEFRNMNAHIFNNMIGYVNDEGIRVGKNGRVISEYNYFDLGCNPGVSGPRVVRYVLPQELPLGVLHSVGDIISNETLNCLHTKDEAFITTPGKHPFKIPYDYKLIKSEEEILSFVGASK
ncbi:MAG: hypothetical protein NE328_13720 [Lentisphaeraceae bacterium]|nr:hypothetical protein [Lentisphaeraceae bacterium]